MHLIMLFHRRSLLFFMDMIMLFGLGCCNDISFEKAEVCDGQTHNEDFGIRTSGVTTSTLAGIEKLFRPSELSY